MPFVGFAMKLSGLVSDFFETVDDKDTSSIGISCIALASLLSFADLVSFYHRSGAGRVPPRCRQLVAGF